MRDKQVPDGRAHARQSAQNGTEMHGNSIDDKIPMENKRTQNTRNLRMRQNTEKESGER